MIPFMRSSPKLSRVVAHTCTLSTQKALAEDDHVFEVSPGFLEKNSLRKQIKLSKSPELNHRRQNLTMALGDTCASKALFAVKEVLPLRVMSVCVSGEVQGEEGAI